MADLKMAIFLSPVFFQLFFFFLLALNPLTLSVSMNTWTSQQY